MAQLDRREKFNQLVAAAAAQVQSEQPAATLNPYDQGRIDELNRILALISARLDFLNQSSAGARELRLLRIAALDR